MKHLATKEVKHLVQLLDKAPEYGMQHRLIPTQLQHQVMKHQPMRNQQDEIDGMKRRKPKEKHPVITVVGLKRQKLIASKAMVSLNLPHQEPVRGDHVGMKHRQMRPHR